MKTKVLFVCVSCMKRGEIYVDSLNPSAMEIIEECNRANCCLFVNSKIVEVSYKAKEPTTEQAIEFTKQVLERKMSDEQFFNS